MEGKGESKYKMGREKENTRLEKRFVSKVSLSNCDRLVFGEEKSRNAQC